LTFPLAVAASSAIELTFTAFSIEAEANCGYDYVQVLNTDNSQLVKACGTNKPSVLKSTGNKMTVVFHSDSSEVKTGFLATWKSVAAASLASSGEISSPNYPKNYPDKLKKEWKITVDAGKKIELTIDDMNIEQDGTNCPYDSLKVYNTPASGSSAGSILAVSENYENILISLFRTCAARPSRAAPSRALAM
jgi:cubilin